MKKLAVNQIITFDLTNEVNVSTYSITIPGHGVDIPLGDIRTIHGIYDLLNAINNKLVSFKEVHALMLDGLGRIK